MTARLLIVDDERSMREFLTILFKKEGYEVESADSGEAAVERVNDDFDVVLTDLKMIGLSGLDVLKAFFTHAPGTQVIMMTAFATADTAIEAMKQGAADYLTKPFKVDAVKVVVEKAYERALLTKENYRLKKMVEEQNRFEDIVGRSPRMQQVFEMVSRVAGTRTTVLISGESGTGKELVAKAVHARSKVADGPFLPINCGAIPEDLIESELFGHVKGSFTGASRDKEGLFQAAHGGTVFLDEIGELPLNMQVKLLRVLQEKKVKKVGSVREESIDCRIVAASNRDLRQMVSEGKFREDLYFRLNIIQILLPALRERRGDIPLLIEHFLQYYSKEHGKVFLGVHEDAMKIMLGYHYPGNVRELENILERLVTLEASDWLTREGLPYHMMQEQSFNSLTEDMEIPAEGLDLEGMVERLERNLLLKALQRAGGVRKHAAELLGISFRSIRYRLDKYGIHEDDFAP